MATPFANPEYQPSENPDGSFPWGAVVGLGIAGVTAAVVILKWNDIVKAVNPSAITSATKSIIYGNTSGITAATGGTSGGTSGGSSSGQQPTSGGKYGIFNGKIRAPDNTPVKGAEIKLEHNGKIIATRKSDGNGWFQFDPVLPGDYKVTITHPCYITVPYTYTFTNEDIGYGTIADPVQKDVGANLTPVTHETFSHTLDYNKDKPTIIDAGMFKAVVFKYAFNFCQPRKVSSVMYNVSTLVPLPYIVYLIKTDGTRQEIGKNINNGQQITTVGAKYLSDLGEATGIEFVPVIGQTPEFAKIETTVTYD